MYWKRCSFSNKNQSPPMLSKTSPDKVCPGEQLWALGKKIPSIHLDRIMSIFVGCFLFLITVSLLTTFLPSTTSLSKFYHNGVYLSIYDTTLLAEKTTVKVGDSWKKEKNKKFSLFLLNYASSTYAGTRHLACSSWRVGISCADCRFQLGRCTDNRAVLYKSAVIAEAQAESTPGN